MGDLKEMANAPLDLFGNFIAEARAIMAERPLLPATALEKFQQARESFCLETERLLKTFRQRVLEREEELRAILHPSRLDLSAQAREAIAMLSQVTHRLVTRHEQVRSRAPSASTGIATPRGEVDQPHGHARSGEGEAPRHGPTELVDEGLMALDRLSRTISRLYLSEKLARTWEKQSAATILDGYRDALTAGEIDAIEIFEAEAEPILARKGDPETLAAFRNLKSRPMDARMTPAQRQAKAALEELRQIKEEAALSICLLASVSKFHAGLIHLCTQWRQEVRHRVDPQTMRGIAVALRKDPEPPLSATVVDWSNSGLRAQCPRKFSPGTVIGVSVSFPQGTQQTIASRAEVRWLQEHPHQPGRYFLGLRILDSDQVHWSALLTTFPGRPAVTVRTGKS